MLKDVTGIRLEGANFQAPTDLQLFADDHLQGNSAFRICLLYGKNGSGKTTISRAFRKASGGSEMFVNTAVPIDANSTAVSLSEDDKAHIAIFNEEFIDRQVRFQSDGLETVVILGAAVDIEDQLKTALEQLSIITESKKAQAEIVSRLQDSTCSDSPRYWEFQVENSLRGPDNWAERDMALREGARQATRVTSTTYLQFLSRKPEKSRDALIYDYQCGLQELKRARSGEARISTTVPQMPQIDFDDNAFIALLSEKIEEPVLSDREKFLLSLVKQGKHGRIQEIKAFASSKEDVCPFCLQDVSEEQKASLIASVEKVLHKAVEAHKKKLESYRQTPITLNLSPFSPLGEITSSCEALIQDYNAEIAQINSVIDQKISNVFSPIITKIELRAKHQAVVTALTELEALRQAHNKKVTNTRPLIEKLQDINSDIASYDIAAPYEKYLTQKKIHDAAVIKLDSLKQEYDEALNVVRSLQERKKSVVIAKDMINRWLSFIFYSNNRISLESNGEKYYVKSSGNAITPEKLSTGERNSLALCYFFSTIMEGKEKAKIYEEPYLIVIDDPISSFDIENCVGVLSFLKCQLQPYLCGHDDTKVLIMTHDLQTYYNLQKVSEELISACSRKGKKNKYSQLELLRNSVKLFQLKKRHEYTALMMEVYDFAVNGSEEKLSTIGNSMRRVIEAFSSFVYKCSIQELSTKQDILLQIDPSIAPYFEHLLYRLVLNGGSHMEESIQTLGTHELDEYFSKQTMQRTAQDILCLLYCLNSLHIKTHLSGASNVEPTINRWINDIKQRTP